MKKMLVKVTGMICALIMAVTAGVPVCAKESGDKANSYRYENGQPIEEITPFASVFPKAWKKISGKYRSSNGSVIKGAVAKGIDVSHNQGTINWQQVKADGIDFAIIRCGYGMNQSDQDDSQWMNNVRGCEKYGIPYGVYLYSYADTIAKAKSEAAHVLRLVRGHKITYPIYYDLEDNYILSHTNAKQRQKIIQTFTAIIKKAGYSVGIFAPKSWFEKELPKASFNHCDKWVAHWNTKCTYQGTYQMWQATNQGRVNGINGMVDINFLMLPTPKTTVRSIAKKKVKVLWNQKGNGIKVQIFYSAKKNKGYKKVATVNATKGKVVIKKKLKSKKNYYFKIRILKSVKGHSYYSDFSKPKKIKVI